MSAILLERPEINRIVLIPNGSAEGPTNSELVDMRIEQWQKPEANGDRAVDVLPSKATVAETVDMLNKDAHIDDKTLIEYLGGDGLFNVGIQAQEKLGLRSPTSTPGGGDSCCIARELHPLLVHRKWPHGAVQYPSARHYQLEAIASHKEIREDDPRHTIMALGFITMGYTSNMTDVLTREEMRQKTRGQPEAARLKIQLAELRKHLPYDDKFLIEDDRGERYINELALQNSHFIAKMFKFRGLSVFDSGYGRVESGEAFTYGSIAKLFLKTMIGQYEHLDYWSRQNFRITTPGEEPFVLEADGEIQKYPSGTEFTVRQRRSHIPLVTSAFNDEQGLRAA